MCLSLQGAKTFMRKKIFTVFIALMMTAVLCFTAACDGGKQQNDQELSYQQQSYEIALEKGYDGTLEEWIELLRGEDGEDGKAPAPKKPAPKRKAPAKRAS